MGIELMPKLKIESENNGKRLDVVLAGAYPAYSRSFLQKVMRQGGVTRQGAALSPDYRVRTGELLDISNFEDRISNRSTKLFFNKDRRFDIRNPIFDSKIVPAILFEDDDFMVLDKPAGLVVHPAPGHKGDTLVDWLRQHVGATVSGAFPDQSRLGLVHRLDKDTSGVLLIAKNVIAQTALSRQFRDRSIQKTYAAFIEGVPKAKKGVISAPVGRSRKHPMLMAVSGAGRPSETSFEVKESLQEVSQVTLFPKTGRTHQIRVHMAAIGHPIVGDRTYGSKSIWSERFDIHRPLLHAERLGLRHPVTEKAVSFHAPWPKDFLEAQKRFRQAFVLLLLSFTVLGSSLRADDTSAPAATSASVPASAPAKKTTHHASSGSSSSGTSSAYRALKKDVAALKDSLAALKDQLTAIQTGLDQLDASSRLRDLEHAISDLNGKAVSGANAAEETKTQVMEIGQKLKAQQDSLGQLQDRVDRLQQALIQKKAQQDEAPSAGTGK